MGTFVDVSGKKFNKLTFIKRCGVTKDKRALWECLCDCGNTVFLDSYRVKNGNTKSCGCYKKKVHTKKFTKHGMSIDGVYTEYTIWKSMKSRCYNKNNMAYKHYGGRGIKVCDRWVNSFQNFLEDMGSRESSEYTLERIDNNGDYEPSNCKWATWSEQAKNRRNNVFYKHLDMELTLSDWAKIFNCNQANISYFILKGYSFDYIYDYFTNNKRKMRRLLK